MGRDYEQVRQDLARNMKDFRGKRGLSQEALALSADVDRTYVSQIERAVGNPSLLVLCKLGAILETDVLDLLAAGLTADQVLEELPDLEPDDVRAALQFASEQLETHRPAVA